ncbi:hypothetical protein Vadar_008341 [Vaccinium darrowii]|uniref:Uncharacterized protein n=1 Tax=Vaccinium darrowii TaxID=229202 RepID=A0ACB7ZBA6_9ERIC|nr:hypothetical protein Vadar_008341 [Vaccinium darrowii]
MWQRSTVVATFSAAGWFRSCEDDGDGNGYFVSTVRVLLNIQQIKKAYKILSSSNGGGGQRSTGIKDARPNSTTLQFGEVIFQREVTRKATSDTSYKMLEGNLSGAILCEE